MPLYVIVFFSTTAGLFLFLTPSFVLGCRELLRLQRPRQAHGAPDHRGTRCVGQVAARKNNACGVDIAYDSKTAGIRILGGRITTTDEATALTYGVYSCSLGPRDNGHYECSQISCQESFFRRHQQ